MSVARERQGPPLPEKKWRILARQRVLTVLVVLALTAAAPTIAAARAHQTTCSGPLTGTFDGGIIVAAGASCLIHDAIVNGGVTMSDPSSSLEICDSTVNGRVVVTAATCVTLGLGPDDVPTTCSPDTINGNVSIENVDNDTSPGSCPGVADVEIEDSSINGGADLNNNDTLQVEGNSSNGTLKCEGNVAPSGFGNTVTGQKKGQCATF